MDGIPTDPHGVPHAGFKVARIMHLHDLESGSYWPTLKPYFLRPDYLRLRYAIQGRANGTLSPGRTVSVRGANKAGELDIAFVADSLAATMWIADPGLDDYCLTLIGRGNVSYHAAGSPRPQRVGARTGLVYRGTPGTTVSASAAHERLSIWIPRASLTQRLAALLDGPVAADAEFRPLIDWSAPAARSLGQLLSLLMAELQSADSAILGSEAATRSFADLMIYAMLRSLPHSYSAQLDRKATPATPGKLRRAEAFIRANVEAPIALHEVAAAAGCSVRSLQIAFRSFRETTPLLAIRTARLEAARAALRTADGSQTVTEVALRFGFANPGRFTRLYREAFGESPRDARRGGRA